VSGKTRAREPRAGAGPRALRDQRGTRAARRGARRLAEADFERAERAFGRALGASTITREELVAIFEGRAMSRWALGDDAGARADLAALASLDPGHALPPEAPPPLVSALAEVAREPLTISLIWEAPREAGAETYVHVAVRNDVARLTRTVRVHVRTDEGWSVHDERDVAIPARRGAPAEVWVEALGPGGAVLAVEGSERVPAAPSASSSGAPGEDLVGGAREAEERSSGDTAALWIGVGVGAAVVLAVLVGVAVAAASPQSELTQPAAPVLIGF
jgi:hypothetical protein